MARARSFPVTVVDVLLGRETAEGLSEERSCENGLGDMRENREGRDNSQRTEECNISDDKGRTLRHPTFFEMCSFLGSHNFLTPTVMFPIFDTLAFRKYFLDQALFVIDINQSNLSNSHAYWVVSFQKVSSVWWNYWYSMKMIVYWLTLQGTAVRRVSS